MVLVPPATSEPSWSTSLLLCSFVHLTLVSSRLSRAVSAEKFLNKSNWCSIEAAELVWTQQYHATQLLKECCAGFVLALSGATAVPGGQWGLPSACSMEAEAHASSSISKMKASARPFCSITVNESLHPFPEILSFSFFAFRMQKAFQNPWEFVC